MRVHPRTSTQLSDSDVNTQLFMPLDSISFLLDGARASVSVSVFASSSASAFAYGAATRYCRASASLSAPASAAATRYCCACVQGLRAQIRWSAPAAW